MGGECKPQEAGREQKFVSLDGAIHRLSRAADEMGALITEMEEGPSSPTTQADKTVRDAPRFQHVYDEAPGRIMEITDRFRKMTEELRSRLF